MLTQLRRDLADAVLPRFADGPPARQQLQELFDGEMPLGQVCDVLAYALPLPVGSEAGAARRAARERRAAAIADALRVSAARADRQFPPPFSPN